MVSGLATGFAPEEKKESRMSKDILIIGSGVVGGATGKGLQALGNHVVFHDIDEAVLARHRDDGYETAADYDLNNFDISILSVNTPTRTNRIVFNYLHRAVEKLGSKLAVTNRYHMIIIRCTLPPGTVVEEIIPILEYFSGKKAGRDFGLAVNPEFLRAVSAADDFLNPWLVVIGPYDKKSERIMRHLYQSFADKIEVVDIRIAEIMKYVHNLFNATKISFFNEIHMVCKELDIDSDKVASLVARSAEGMWNPAYGTKGGRPYGGTCLPKDTRAFRAFARSLELNPMILLDAVIKVNEEIGEPIEIDETWLPETRTAPAFGATVTPQAALSG